MLQVIEKIVQILKNKYLLATLLFVIWIIFFDQNNLMNRVVLIKKYQQMQESKNYYTKKIVEDKQKLIELQTDRENLEKFAREQYYMKRDNEDVFIIDK